MLLTKLPAFAAISPPPICPNPCPSNPSTTAYRRSPPRRRLANRAQRFQGRALHHRPRQPTPNPFRSQWRSFPGRKPIWQNQNLSRRRRRRQAKQVSTFATDLHQPFGIAFYPLGPKPKWIYIGDTDEIVRFPYTTATLSLWPAGAHHRPARRRQTPRRRPLDTRSRLHPGRL